MFLVPSAVCEIAEINCYLKFEIVVFYYMKIKLKYMLFSEEKNQNVLICKNNAIFHKNFTILHSHHKCFSTASEIFI